MAVLTAALAAGWAWLMSLPASLGYTVEAEFTELPPDDTALENWLLSQPGVASAFVGQRAGDPKVLVIHLLMTRNSWGQPPLPDFEAKCEELGYRGREGRFRDSTREGGISPRTASKRPASGEP
jgi:hypothetical protein